MRSSLVAVELKIGTEVQSGEPAKDLTVGCLRLTVVVMVNSIVTVNVSLDDLSSSNG